MKEVVQDRAKAKESEKTESEQAQIKIGHTRRGERRADSIDGRIILSYWVDEDQGIQTDQWACIAPLGRRLLAGTSQPSKKR